MKLNPEELSCVQDGWTSLLEFAYRKRAGNPNAELYDFGTDFREIYRTADYLYENRSVIDEYLDQEKVSDSTRIMLLRWQKYARAGLFIALGLDQGDAIWMSSDGLVWRVRALMDDWEYTFRGEKLPLMVKGAILPFRDTLIPDGLFTLTPMKDPKSRKSMVEILKAAKRDGTILTTIPWMETDQKPDQDQKSDQTQEETVTASTTEVRYRGGLKTMRKGRKKKPSGRR